MKDQEWEIEYGKLRMYKYMYMHALFPSLPPSLPLPLSLSLSLSLSLTVLINPKALSCNVLMFSTKKGNIPKLES